MYHIYGSGCREINNLEGGNWMNKLLLNTGFAIDSRKVKALFVWGAGTVLWVILAPWMLMGAIASFAWVTGIQGGTVRDAILSLATEGDADWVKMGILFDSGVRLIMYGIFGLRVALSPAFKAALSKSYLAVAKGVAVRLGKFAPKMRIDISNEQDMHAFADKLLLAVIGAAAIAVVFIGAMIPSPSVPQPSIQEPIQAQGARAMVRMQDGTVLAGRATVEKLGRAEGEYLLRFKN